ncbi:hypothetical protein BDZ91DRAFT_804822 [Kalaharituber pfeilii]|nr:hypothetical protein BDZ91DRAFT_804822 [Kalaharituber pfeilii]
MLVLLIGLKIYLNSSPYLNRLQKLVVFGFFLNFYFEKERKKEVPTDSGIDCLSQVILL